MSGQKKGKNKVPSSLGVGNAVRVETNESTDSGKTLEREKVNRPSHTFGGQAAVSEVEPSEQAVSKGHLSPLTIRDSDRLPRRGFVPRHHRSSEVKPPATWPGKPWRVVRVQPGTLHRSSSLTVASACRKSSCLARAVAPVLGRVRDGRCAHGQSRTGVRRSQGPAAP